MTSSTLAAVASAALSLLFSYIPVFKNWFDPQHPNIKRLVMIAMLAIVAVLSFGIACLGVGDLIKLNIPCSAYGALGLIQTLIAAIAANQTVYLLSPKSDKKHAQESPDKDNSIEDQIKLVKNVKPKPVPFRKKKELRKTR